MSYTISNNILILQFDLLKLIFTNFTYRKCNIFSKIEKYPNFTKSVGITNHYLHHNIVYNENLINFMHFVFL